MTPAVRPDAAADSEFLPQDAASGAGGVIADEFSIFSAGERPAREEAPLEDAEREKRPDIRHEPCAAFSEIQPLDEKEESLLDRVWTEYLLKNPHDAELRRRRSEESGPAAAGSLEAARGVPGLVNDSRIWRVEAHPQLREALKELSEAREEAREEEYPEPSAKALENAERLLREMYKISPRTFLAYPTLDGKIAIDAPGGCGCSVILLCASDGSASCLVNMDASYRRERYLTADSLPNKFLREALEELEKRMRSSHENS